MTEDERLRATQTLVRVSLEVRCANTWLNPDRLPAELAPELREARLLLAAAIEKLEAPLTRLAPNLRPIHVEFRGTTDENGDATFEIRLNDEPISR